MGEGLEEAVVEQSQEARIPLGGAAAAAAAAIAAAEAVTVTRHTYCRSGVAVQKMFVLGEVIEDLS